MADGDREVRPSRGIRVAAPSLPALPRHFVAALTLSAALIGVAALGASGARATDLMSGRPGALYVAPVVGSHYNPCAPGGLHFDVAIASACWQAYLGSSTSPVVGRSPRSPRRTQLVTVIRRIYRTWLPTDTAQLAVQRSVTRPMAPGWRTLYFPAWAEVTSSGFGYHFVIYTVVWKDAVTRTTLGVRSRPAPDFRCQTYFPCTAGPNWVWLGDTD